MVLLPPKEVMDYANSGGSPSPIDFEKFSYFAEQYVVFGNKPKEAVDKQLKIIFDHFDLDKDGILSDSEYENFKTTVVTKTAGIRVAFLVVDFQNDFVQGSLAIKNGSAKQDARDALPQINALLDEYGNRVKPSSWVFPYTPCFQTVVYTFDWHPENHISFLENCTDPDRELSTEDKERILNQFDNVTFVKPVKLKQTLYPKHCIANTWGAELDDSLVFVKADEAVKVIKIHKGIDIYQEVYSGFGGRDLESGQTLLEILNSNRIDALLVCGLATDICVAATIRDALNAGFKYVGLVLDCSAGLDKEAIQQCCDEFRSKFVAIMDRTEVEEFMNGIYGRRPLEWIMGIISSS